MWHEPAVRMVDADPRLDLNSNAEEGELMLRRKMNRLMPIGLVLLASGLLLHRMHGDYVESISGFLIGISIVFLIAGFVGRSQQVS